jgi:hypothetical protein
VVITKFDKVTGILRSRFEGNVTLEEIIEYIDETRKNISYPRGLKILTEADNAEFDFKPDDLLAIVEANNKSIEEYDYIIDAIIVSDSKATALSMLYQEFSKNKKYRFNIFSTKEAASEWLKKIQFYS